MGYYKTHRQYLEASIREWKRAVARWAEAGEADTPGARESERLLHRAVAELEMLDVRSECIPCNR